MKRRDIDADVLLLQAVLGLTPLTPASPELPQILAALHEVAPLILQAIIHGFGDVTILVRAGQVEVVELRQSTRVRLEKQPIPIRRRRGLDTGASSMLE